MTVKYIYGIILMIGGHLKNEKAKVMTIISFPKYK